MGQARESMMELTQDVWWCLFVTHLAARCWTFSIVFMLFAERGSQTVAEYSRIGRTKALYAVSLVFLFPIFRFLLRKPSVLFAFIADSVYVESPIQVVLYVYAKVFCCADVLQVVSV